MATIHDDFIVLAKALCELKHAYPGQQAGIELASEEVARVLKNEYGELFDMGRFQEAAHCRNSRGLDVT